MKKQNIEPDYVVEAPPVRVLVYNLVVGENVRRTVDLSDAFKASIKERGVRVPVIVRRDVMGYMVVVDGQRRVLAARAVGVESVPVVFTEDIGDDADRIVEQLEVNRHREAVSTPDTAEALFQLSKTLTAAQVVKRTGRTREEVKAAAALATKATSEVREAVATMDLVTAAAITDIADGDEKIAAEIAEDIAERPDQVEYILQESRLDQECRRIEQEGITEYEALGYAVNPECRDFPLFGLTASPVTGGDEPPGISIEEHATCEGRAVKLAVLPWIKPLTLSVTHYCVDPQKYGHHDRWPSAGSSSKKAADNDEQAKADVKKVRENNKASDVAEVVRRKFCVGLLAAPPKEAILHAATMIGRFPDLVHQYATLQILDELLPLSKRDVYLHTGASKVAQERILLGFALAIGEKSLPRDFWRTPLTCYAHHRETLQWESAGRLHVERLISWGYQAADVEADWLAGTGVDQGQSTETGLNHSAGESVSEGLDEAAADTQDAVDEEVIP
ncbi:MAG: ParB N-terminal domain-containing protein [Cellulomonadaceae bacterium]|jgi:ParB family chromosome partitioning protein|nr:ParB N-terminal domain-containing protein [Cellulomonadaceae bacterium]